MADISFNNKLVRYTAVSATADGDNTVIAAPGAGKAILVLNYSFRMLGAVGGEAVTVRSGAAGTVHLVEVAATTPGARVTHQGDPEVGAFLLDANTALNINNAAGADVFGHLAYRIISI